MQIPLRPIPRFLLGSCEGHPKLAEEMQIPLRPIPKFLFGSCEGHPKLAEEMQIPLRPITRVCLLVGCLASQQQASVSQGRICSDNFTCCHTETEVADQTFYLTHSILTPGRPVPVLTLYIRAPGRVPIFKSLV